MRPRLPSFESASRYLSMIDQSAVYSNFGPLVKELESRFAQYFGISDSQVVALANATLALQGCIEISEAQEWAVPNFTFAATGLAVLQTQKRMSLFEVSDENWQIELDFVSRQVYGIVPVLPFGCPVDLDKYSGFSSVVVDAAASLGAPINGLENLHSKHFVVYSLHATKVLGAGEGAIVICGSVEAAQELRTWSNFGFFGSRVSIIKGTNAKMSEFTAAYGLASLDQLEKEREEWLFILERKKSLLQSFGLDNFSDHYPGFRPYWIFDARELDPDALMAFLEARQIESRRWWSKPLSRMYPFHTTPVVNGERNSLSLSERLIGLPFWRGMDSESIEYVVKSLVEFRKDR